MHFSHTLHWSRLHPHWMEVGAKMLRRREEEKKKMHVKSDTENRLGFIQSLTTRTRFLFWNTCTIRPNKFAVIFFSRQSLSLSPVTTETGKQQKTGKLSSPLYELAKYLKNCLWTESTCSQPARWNSFSSSTKWSVNLPTSICLNFYVIEPAAENQ